MNREDFYNDIKNRALAIYEQYQYLIKEVIRSEINISKYKLTIHLDEDSNLGGKAWTGNFIDNIHINKGVIDNFFEYFYGYTKNRTEEILVSLNQDMDNMDMSYEYIENKDNGIPLIYDSKIIDYKLAGLLTIMVSRFIITHELGHLLNGHCDYINSKNPKKLNYIPMFEDDKSINVENVSLLDFRTLEMDADSFATTDNIRNLIILYDKFEEKVDKDINIQPIDLFYWWAFSIRSNFIITQRILNDEEYKLEKKHLPSVARWRIILATAIDIVKKDLYKINYREKDNKEKIIEALLSGYIFAERCYNQRFYTNYNTIDETSNSIEYENFSSAVHGNWDILRNDLKIFSRIPLYESGSYA